MDKVHVVCHWLKFSAPVLHIVYIDELLVLSEGVIVTIILIQIQIFLFEECFKSFYLLYHSNET
jgi:hypothetical protein